jgi:Transmembrane secretion effector
MRLLAVSLLRARDFRCLTASVVLNAVGMMGETVALGWLALELTNSPFMVGLAMGARSLPLLVAGVPAGVLADRVSRHRLVVLTGLGQALVSALLGTLALAGRLALPPLILFTLVSGTMRAIEQASRQSYAHDLVGGRGLLDGLALLGVAMRGGWLAGALVTGALLAHGGAGVAYLAVGAGYLGGVLALLPAGPAPQHGAATTGSAWESLVTFLGAVRRDTVLPALMVLTAGAEVLGFSHQTVLPSLARDILRVGAEGLGAMTAARSLGGMLGILAVPALGPVRGSGTVLLAVQIVFGATLVGLALAPSVVGLTGVLVILTLVNAAGALSDVLSQSLMQLAVPPDLRGRAGGAWVVAIGLAPFGQLQIGGLASLFGVAAALASSGLGLVAVAAVIGARARRLRSL